MGDFIYGKLNKETILTEYVGLTTSTASTTVDNTNHTIKVDVIGSTGTGSVEGALLYNKPQYLTSSQINQIYTNIDLLNYLNNNVILQNKPSQSIIGDVNIIGDLVTSSNYLIINSTGLPLTTGNTAGISIKNWSTGKDANIYINTNGELKYNNGNVDQYILSINDNLSINKFTYYTGSTLGTRDIIPTDINTDSYSPTLGAHLTTKSYVDSAVRRDTNYSIVNTVDDFNRIATWAGKRVLILEEATI